MNKRLFNALVSVSSGTSGAKQLAQEVLTETSAELVKKLYQRIKDLEETVSELSAIDEDDGRELTDESAAELTAQIKESLKTADKFSLLRYDISYLRMYPKYMRATIAVVLKNKALELGVPALGEWLDVIALNGEIK